MKDNSVYINDIMMRCLLKWRIALLAMIIGAGLLSVFGIYRQNKAKEAALLPKEKDVIIAEAVAEAESNLPDSQISEVYLAVDRYVGYQHSYNSLYDYYFGSIIGQLDATAVDTVLLSYFVDTHYSVTYPQIDAENLTDTVLAYMTSSFVDKDLCTNISQIIGEDLEEKYISQLISTWRSGNVLFISVKGRNEDECRRIAELAKIRVDVLSSKAKEIITDFDISMLEDRYSCGPDSSLMDNQFNQSNRMATLQNAMNSIIAYMPEDQRTLLKMLALNELEKQREEKIEAGLIEPEEEEEPAPVIIPEIDYIQPKYILVGAFLGLCLVGGCVILYITLGGRLLTQNDIRDVFSLSRLGTWNSGKEPKGIDKWIINMFGGDGVQFGSEESRSMASAGIRLMSEKEGYKKLYITGTANDEGTKKEAERITEVLGKAGLEAQFGRSILYDPESLEAMSGADAVVLIEKIDVSKNSEIEEEVRTCNRQQVPILGYIALR